MRNIKKNKSFGRIIRHHRVRGKIFGSKERPRLSAFRSLKEVYLQLINDEDGKTLIGFSSRGLKTGAENPYQGKKARAYEAGLKLAKAAKEKGVTKICFDRGGYLYHGRVKAAAEGARAGGLEF